MVREFFVILAVFCATALIVTAGFGVRYPLDIYMTFGITVIVVLLFDTVAGRISGHR